MLEIYSYEYIRAANEERRTRALARYERLFRGKDGPHSPPRTGGADVFEIAFVNGCTEPGQVSA